MITQVTKTVEWDMAHRLHLHEGLCKNLHGHRYKMNVTISGEVNDNGIDPDDGMIVDFSQLNSVIKECVVDKLDHACLICSDDKVMMKFHIDNPDMKIVVIPYSPTAENMASWIDNILIDAFEELDVDINIENIRVYETPTSYADYCDG